MKVAKYYGSGYVALTTPTVNRNIFLWGFDVDFGNVYYCTKAKQWKQLKREDYEKICIALSIAKKGNSIPCIKIDNKLIRVTGTN